MCKSLSYILTSESFTSVPISKIVQNDNRKYKYSIVL